jgi:hypothetical protein
MTEKERRENWMEAYNRYLKREVLTHHERTAILFNMCLAAHTVWSDAHKTSSWDKLSIPEKELWLQMMRAAIRVMFGLMAEVVDEVKHELDAPHLDLSKYRKEDTDA